MDKNKNEYKNDEPWGLSDILGPFLKEIAEHYFGSRAKFNEEHLLFISNDHEFQEDIKKIRKELKIPKLDPKEDCRIFENKGQTIEESGFIYGKSEKFVARFEEKIRSILVKHKLPLNFTDGIEYAVLYGKLSKQIPKYNPEVVNQIIKNPKELKRIGLTIQEKKFVKDFVKMKMEKANLPKEKFKYFYKKMCEGLSKSRNNYRRSRTIKTAIKAITKPKVIHEYDWTKGKEETTKYNFKDLAQQISNKELNETEANKESNTLRQQKYRIKRKFGIK